ncbi:hypothetical protein RMATCC62417_07002 [Rhizopus microsporus]|nr:hypothetical protein RMATCC62417_07002 [Rhizopus microsporus]CEI99478.1 hypothetical protein RMCBS344292_13567 [Rhizopus microsporus]CEJ03529.1 hypothetical protein RMCBS344292_17510 [Rhizopus microsporus]
MPKSIVQKVIDRIRETGSPLPRKAPGASKKLSERAQRHLERIIRSPLGSYDSVRFELQQAEITIFRQTVISYLREMGFKSYFAAHKPSLTEANKKRRLRWVRPELFVKSANDTRLVMLSPQQNGGTEV